MKKTIYYAVLAVLAAIFLFAAYKLGSYWLEKIRSDKLLGEASKYVDVQKNDNQDENDLQGDPERIEVNFEELWKLNDDIVAWIYCANTKINYPIVQGYDNDYYLYRLLDGSWNANGSIFMDYGNSSDFSDANTMVYGHHMQNGAMFASLVKYKGQGYYDAHPYMYIMTPEKDYRLDLFAGCVVDSVADIYDFNPPESVIRNLIYNSTFESKIDYPTHNVVTLSTCTYEYDDARYVVLGELVPLDD